MPAPSSRKPAPTPHSSEASPASIPAAGEREWSISVIEITLPLRRAGVCSISVIVLAERNIVWDIADVI